MQAPKAESSEIPSFSEYQPFMLSREALSKVATVLYGVEPENISGEELAKRMTEDQPIVRQKYGLPNRQLLVSQPDDYYRQLDAIARAEGISVRKKEEMEQFFQSRFASAVYMSVPDVIAMDKMADTDDKTKVSTKGQTYEHELIHAQQARKYPRMSLVRKEYEAYISGANPEFLRTQPWKFLERISISIQPAQLEDEWSKYQAEKVDHSGSL